MKIALLGKRGRVEMAAAFWINVFAVLVNVGVLLLAPRFEIPGMYWLTIAFIAINAFVAGAFVNRAFA